MVTASLVASLTKGNSKWSCIFDKINIDDNPLLITAYKLDQMLSELSVVLISS